MTNRRGNPGTLSGRKPGSVTLSQSFIEWARERDGLAEDLTNVLSAREAHKKLKQYATKTPADLERLTRAAEARAMALREALEASRI